MCFDQDAKLLASITVKQEHWAWAYQARLERHVIFQLEAIQALGDFVSHKSVVDTLLDAADNEQLYYRVRQQAILSLAKVCSPCFVEGLLIVVVSFIPACSCCGVSCRSHSSAPARTVMHAVQERGHGSERGRGRTPPFLPAVRWPGNTLRGG